MLKAVALASPFLLLATIAVLGIAGSFAAASPIAIALYLVAIGLIVWARRSFPAGSFRSGTQPGGATVIRKGAIPLHAASYVCGRAPLDMDGRTRVPRVVERGAGGLGYARGGGTHRLGRTTSAVRLHRLRRLRKVDTSCDPVRDLIRPSSAAVEIVLAVDFLKRATGSDLHLMS